MVLQFKRNPYYRAFCGFTEFSCKLPCDSSELVYFRKRIGTEGVDKLFQCSLRLLGKAALEDTVNIDTTVQEKNITYPTDGKLAIKIINRLNKLAKAYGIQQRRTYAKEVKALRLNLRHFRHVSRRAKANNKIYALHEPGVYCIGKGKDHKPYEYGNKVSIAATAKSNIIVGVVSHPQNQHDSKTLPEVLAHCQNSRGKAVKTSVCDHGYRGPKTVGDTQIILPAPPLKRDNRYQRDKKRKRCQRRAAIEPIIGHLKADFRLTRNFLKGVAGTY